ncbi:MAG: selenocysteine-specific translation elongation factor [Chloroflexota bacterium]
MVKVVGTAGHIDHGKSTLVRRLTGIDPDRLEEEKRRGMTIDLGFAWLTLPSGQDISIVDVPGHERFIKNMLAGAAGIDVALVVVAADEGVMPQTREHLDILGLLDVRHGVVALTKADIVDDDWRDLVEEDVRTALAETSLRSAPIVPVSAVTGGGIDELLAALDEAVAVSDERRDVGVPYLPVDRVFSVRGFGTVVTGTLHSGLVRVDEELEVLPGGRRVRVRGLQTHGEHRHDAGPGSRVAINVSGATRDDIERGDVLARPGTVRSVSRIDCLARVLDSSPIALAHGSQVTAHIGAAERAATVSVLAGPVVEPGETGWIQLRFDAPVAVVRGQHVVLRMPAPARTIAGGVVVDVAPRHRRSDARARERLAALASETLPVATLAALAGNKPIRTRDIALVLGVAPARVDDVLAGLEAEGKIRKLGEWYLTSQDWSALKTRCETLLHHYHQRQPLRKGMSKEELGQNVGWSGASWTAAVEAMTGEDVMRQDGSVLALPAHRGGTAGRPEEVDRVLQVLRRDPYAPPTAAELCAMAGTDGALLAALGEEGEIVRVQDGLYFARDAVDRVRTRVLDIIRREGQVTVAGLRDAIGTSRKYALALLEHLDAQRVTKRAGDVRVLGAKADSCT